MLLFIIACNAMPQLSAAGTATFQQLSPGTQVTSLSADGRVAAGKLMGGGVWTWTLPGGLTVLTDSDGTEGNAALSADGSVLAATKGVAPSMNATAAIFKDGNWFVLSGMPRPSSVWGMSSDASVVVGLAPVSETGRYPVDGAVWNADGSGADSLPSTISGSACRANAAASGGRVIGGWQDLEDGARAGAVWEFQDGKRKQRIIRDAMGYPLGEVTSVSADGKVITGLGFGKNGGWVILPGETMPTVLGSASGASAAFSASADGTLVGGAVGQVGGIPRTGFLCTRAHGVESILSALRRLLGDALPNDVTASMLGTVTAISADGSTVAGWGSALSPAGRPAPHGWVAHIGSGDAEHKPASWRKIANFALSDILATGVQESCTRAFLASAAFIAVGSSVYLLLRTLHHGRAGRLVQPVLLG